ncbi:hypothetical protein BKA66DRAFT_602766 [Pyrenochaeta sp. MPI-SDFR-AT-0127]|nr:hypothetical protein BKA66DRAFT_602766 [Pyrenochaeta sp. MPI-SDFR-AT-0127]
MGERQPDHRVDPRKKSKCSREKPECSCCVRLKQACVYARHYRARSSRADDFHDTVEMPDTNHSIRLSAIEGRLDQLAAAIDLRGPSVSSISPAGNNEPSIPQSSWNSATMASPDSLIAESNSVTTPNCLQLHQAVISEGIALYFSNYCNQPCPILSQFNSFDLSTENPLPAIILYPLLALSLRSSRSTSLGGRQRKRELVETITQHSWNLLTKAYCAFDLDDTYLQGLCLLAQVDAGDGRTERAQTQIAIGLKLAQSRGMLGAKALDGLEPVERIRRQEIVWSLFMLDRMLLGSNTREPSIPTTAFELPIFQGGPSHPDQSFRPYGVDHLLISYESETPRSLHSVVSLNMQILRIWECVLADVTRPPSDNDVPLWRHDSARAVILTRLLDFETRCQNSSHNYSTTGPPTRVLEEPRLRDYYLAWVHFQLVLSVIQCCLNHPFIIYAKTTRFKQRVPLTFLQKSYEYSMIHANWVFRLIDDMENAGLVVHDPFLGHLVAIAASIHLEHTLSQHAAVAASAKRKSDRCINFVKRMSEDWPNMLSAVELLGRLKSRICHRSNMNYVEDEYDGAVPSNDTCQVELEDEDLQLMWAFFDYASKPSNTSTQYSPGDDWTAERMDQSRSTEIGGASSVVVNQCSDVPPSITQSSVQAADMHVSNHAHGPTFNYEASDASYGDWSLFGKSWIDYFPVDIAFEQ